LSFLSNTIYGYVSTHKKYFENHIDLIISNYSKQNLILWKRKVMLCICIYIIFSTLIITIDNYLIFVSTLQTAISFIICDFLENPENLRQYKQLNIFIDNINQLIFPRVYHKNNTIIDDYMSPLIKLSKSTIIKGLNINDIIEPLSLIEDLNDNDLIEDLNDNDLHNNLINNDLTNNNLKNNNLTNNNNLINNNLADNILNSSLNDIINNNDLTNNTSNLFNSPIFNIIKKTSFDTIETIENKPKTPPSIKSIKK
jgi:hypothetical protein